MYIIYNVICTGIERLMVKVNPGVDVSKGC